jgi:hypothetical protein
MQGYCCYELGWQEIKTSFKIKKTLDIRFFTFSNEAHYWNSSYSFHFKNILVFIFCQFVRADQKILRIPYDTILAVCEQ